MRKFLILTLIVMGGAAAYFTFFTQASSKHSLTEKNHSMTEASPTIKEVTTPEGHSVWLAPSDTPVVSIGIVFLGAGRRAAFQSPGLTDLLTSVLDEGAGPYNSQAFKTRLLEKNIQLGISANHDNLVITFRTIKENVKEAFQLVQLMMTAPRFEDEDMKRVKQQVGASLEQSLNDPKPVGLEALHGFVLGDVHPYNPRTAECIKNIPTITAHHLRDYMAGHLTQSTVQIVAAGDISSGDLSDLVDPFVSSLSNQIKQTTPDRLPYQNLGGNLNVEMDIPQTVIYFLQKGVSVNHPDFYAFFMINRILSNAFESRLWHEVREKRGLAYFCATNLSNNDLNDVLTGITATKTETVAETIQIIKKEWDKLVAGGVTQEELDFHKKNAIGAYALNFGSTLEIVSVLLWYRQRQLSLHDLNQRNLRIQNLTVEEINRVITEQIKPHELAFVTIGKYQEVGSKR
ncbi:M16 family metallopeptidase [Candidatus Finniella inopinata]|uniref:Insulinase family protein n=1 Tax=Candidatus Finniella inopinata TaxID=1696036 RepID=A0A4Q7DLQ4_9PROT|nr:pitrilysin family protein [Candidatus Finniella inopinata]RZI45676.1 insulinase family protein [Candidatus Finniella inopinata]